jgi:RNA polymerase sigma factor (sigma-70 family)
VSQPSDREHSAAAGPAVHDGAGAPGGGVARSADLAALHALHAPALRRFCLRLTRDRTAAEDLEQETFARFMARLPHLDPAVNVGAYLHTTARNLYVKGLRARAREFADDLIEEHAGCDDDLERDPSRSLLLAEQIEQMRRSARRLNGRQRRAIVLREVHGRSYAEIADALGVSEDAVAQTISRARARLRTEYRREAAPAAAATPDCPALHDALSAYVDGRLHGPARDELERHLGRCAACREVLAAYREAGVRLRAGAPLSPLAALVERLSLAFHGAANQAASGVAVVAGGAAIVAAGAGGLVVAHGVAPSAVPAHAAPAASVTTSPPDRAASSGATTGVAPSGPSPGRPTPAAPAGSGAGAAGGTSVAGAGTPGPAAGTGGAPAAPNPGPSGGAGSTGAGVPADPGPSPATPKVRTPAVTTPAVTTPHVSVAAVTTPAIATPVATVPPVSTPQVELPPVTVPAVTVPAVTVPPVTLSAPKLP